jgi:hypothetical protein
LLAVEEYEKAISPPVLFAANILPLQARSYVALFKRHTAASSTAYRQSMPRNAMRICCVGLYASVPSPNHCRTAGLFRPRACLARHRTLWPSEDITTFKFGKDSPQPTIVEGKLTALWIFTFFKESS